MAKRKISFHEYFMGIADAVKRRADCLGSHVGAVIVIDNRVIATGYNGTAEEAKNCLEGGCRTCKKKLLRRTSEKKSTGNGQGYDECVCVHAEQNAMASAARFGTPVEGGVMYCTTQPCFTCAKQMLQVKIKKVIFRDPWTPDESVKEQYEKLLGEFSEGVDQYAAELKQIFPGKSRLSIAA